MGQYNIDNPVLVELKNVDSNGKVHLSKSWAHKKARVIVEAVHENHEDEEAV